MNVKRAYKIFEKVKSRFFGKELQDYRLNIIQEPTPFFNGTNVYIMGWQDKRDRTINFKSWTIDSKSNAFSFYIRCIHELAHALVVDTITHEQNVNHDKIWAIECLKRYRLFCKNKRLYDKAISLDWWYVDGKKMRSRVFITRWGLDKLEYLCYT